MGEIEQGGQGIGLTGDFGFHQQRQLDEGLLPAEVALLDRDYFGNAGLHDRELHPRLDHVRRVDDCRRQHAGDDAAAREALAAVVGADPDDIVGQTNATAALNIVAQSLPLQPGDQILTTDHEYSALEKTWAYVCRKTGAKVVVVKVPMPFVSEQAFLDTLVAGMTDVLKGTGSKIAPAEAQEIMTKLQTEMQAKTQAKAGESAKKNIEEGKAFLEKNAKAEGVKTTASGLQYSVMKEGAGEKPKATDTVKVHYHGTLLDGKVFDSSVERNDPATFPLDGVIKGWTEGLQLMTVGSKYKFVLPSELAYGERGAGGDIGPNAVLTFEVELLEIVKGAK